MTLKPTDDDLEINWDVDHEYLQPDDTSEEEVVEEEDHENKNEKKRAASESLENNDEKKAKSHRKNLKPIHKLSQKECFDLIWLKYVAAYGDHKTDLEKDSTPTEKQIICTDSTFGKHSLASLCRYIRMISPDWKRTFKAKNCIATNSPKIIILSSSALRCVELLKHLKEFDCVVAKLFSRHMKVNEQIEMMTRFHPIAVATPNRLKKLLEIDALSLVGTTHIVIDMNRDSKEYTILDLKDTSSDLMNIFHVYFNKLIAQDKLHIGLY